MTRPRIRAISVSGDELPDDFYIAFVDSLVVDSAALFFSCLVATAMQLVAAFAAKSAILWDCSAAQLLICAVRLYFMGLHSNNRPSANIEIARKQEIIYAIGALTTLTALSLWTLVAFYVTDDGFTRLMGINLTIAYAFGMLTRSFATYRGMNLHLMAAFAPMSVAMAIGGGWYPAAIIVGFIPLMLFMKGSSERLRKNFLAVITAQAQSALFAKRLDMALNNMSHGLVMIDAKDRIALVNQQVLRIFGLREEDARVGADLGGILRKLVRNRVVARAEVDRIGEALFHNSREGDFAVPVETLDKRAIEITVHRMPGEGAVVVVQDVSERRNAALAIDRMARFDPVTELANRRCFEEELAAAMCARGDGGDPVNVLFLDLDDFKQVNDSLGHARGDQLLAAVAGRLQTLVRPSDFLARWGGDEFAILQRPVTGPLQTAELAERIIREIRRPAIVDGYEMIVGASIGSASAPDDGSSPEVILSCADMALYAAKGEGRGHWRAFEKSMDAKIQIRRLIELDLRAAVANDAIEVYYQPIVKAATREIAGFEALARWTHPVRGRVSPGEFIPIIEELGLMDEFGASVLRRACLACASWPDGVSVSINLSPAQFRNGGVERTVLDALAAAKLAPDRLDIEITESTLLDDRGSARATLDSLRKLGVRVSLDDFGTGYSSLSYLLAFPLDRIKIDRSFTIGLGLQERASVLVESVAQMCAKLGMSVLVEGVETDLQMRFIERIGSIAEVQGFYFSPAVPEAEARKMLDEKKRLSAA
jgi:diguanylate cyclase (GGDEF)-like protein